MSTQRSTNLDLVQACDNFPYGTFPTPLYSLYLPIDDRPHGYLFPSNVRKMPWTEDFVVDHTNLTITVKDSSHGSNSASACTAAFAEVINEAIDKDIFIKIHKQHSEPFPILGAKYPVQLERFAADLFGITARGAHLTVYTIDDDKMKIWVPRRSLSLFTYPGKLDSTVAGGVCAGETPKQNIIREAQEEASLPADRVQRNIRAAGVLTYISYEEESLRTKGDENNTPSGTEASIVPDVIYVYDLEVGADVKPVPEDGEVKEFYLMGVEEVKDALARNEFKTNSAVVMIDFFVRHGIITEENEKDYVEIVMRMHRRLPFPTAN